MNKRILIIGNSNGLPGVKVDVENYTRFFIIANENIIIDGSEKISIVTSTDNKSGALMELLQIKLSYSCLQKLYLQNLVHIIQS